MIWAWTTPVVLVVLKARFNTSTGFFGDPAAAVEHLGDRRDRDIGERGDLGKGRPSSCRFPRCHLGGHELSLLLDPLLTSLPRWRQTRSGRRRARVTHLQPGPAVRAQRGNVDDPVRAP